MIVGGRIVYAEAKKEKEEQPAGLSINVSIDEVAVRKDILEVKYTYLVNYEKDMGHLKVIGYIEAKETDAKKIADEWKKTKKLPDSLAEELLNAISFTGTVNGTLITRALNMTPPMVLPKMGIAPVVKGGKSA